MRHDKDNGSDNAINLNKTQSKFVILYAIQGIQFDDVDLIPFYYFQDVFLCCNTSIMFFVLSSYNQ